jgi:zinc and cadmium transporter
MEVIGYIILFTLLGSIVSMLGGVVLLFKENFAQKIAHYLSSFAAGALLGTAFFDLLPEAIEHAEEEGIEVNVMFWVIMGILGFFILERFIHWFHHHHDHKEKNKHKKSIVQLVILGDSVHNFIDGVAIAASFMVSIPLGIATTFAVAAHEIPQEIGDFGILLHRGLKRGRVLFLNFVSALAAMVGALLTVSIGEGIHQFLPIFLAVTAGFFIYISLSDLIPEIHGEDRKDVAFWETVLLLFGVWVIWYAISILHSVAPH